MNTPILKYTRLIVTDLVNSGALASETGQVWVVKSGILGFSEKTAFRSKDELIETVAVAFMNSYGERAGLKAVA